MSNSIMRFRSVVRSFLLNLLYFHSLKKKCVFGRNVKIEGNVSFGVGISFDDNVEVRNRTIGESCIGDNVSINRNTVMRGYFRVGSNCAIAPNCTIVGVNHCFQDRNIPIKQQGVYSKGGIVIEEDVWIGANSVVLDGVTIGRGSVIGAGSIVTKSIPPYSIAVGNPCRVIRSRV